MDSATSALNIPRLVDLEILPPNTNPWIVGLTDLNVVVDVLRRPAELIGYIEFREQWIGEPRLRFSDELEILNVYLYQVDLAARLAQAAPDGFIMHAPNQVLLDSWYDGQAGLGPVVERPRIRMTTRMRRFVDELHRLRPPGWLESASNALQIPITVAKSIDMLEKFLASRAQQQGVYVTGAEDYQLIAVSEDLSPVAAIERARLRGAILDARMTVLLRQRGKCVQMLEVWRGHPHFHDGMIQ